MLTLSSFYACRVQITPTAADKHRQTQYTTRLHLCGSQIRERDSWEDEGILYTGGNPGGKKVPLSGAPISWTEHAVLGGRQWWNDGRYSTFLFLEFSCLHILTGRPLDMEICNLSRIKWYRAREERTRRKMDYVQDTKLGGKITLDYAKIFQTMSAFVLMLYNDVTSTTQLWKAGNIILSAENNEF